MEHIMNEKLFRAFLSSRGFSNENVEKQVSVIQQLEKDLNDYVPVWTFNDLNPSSVLSLVENLIDRELNSSDNMYTLLRYAKAIGNKPMFNTVFEMLDGCEVMDNLFHRLGERVGDELRDTIYEELPLPPLGLSKKEKACYTYRIMQRMEEIFGENFCKDLLSESLRDLIDSNYTDEKTDFYEACNGDIDQYLIFRGKKFLNLLIEYQHRGDVFFGQEINNDVIDFVKSNPEIGGGIRDGDFVYETKLPYNTAAYLEEKDPVLKRYHYCHCPWVKESIRNENMRISDTFCLCSAGFHKKPFEIIFDQKLNGEVLQSVLKGDPVCRFRISLPNNDK